MVDRALMRYAVIGTLLREGRPVCLDELAGLLRAARPIDDVVGPMTPKRLSDLLRAQVAHGRARRVRRGCYEAIPSSMSRTTRWRYQQWEWYYDDLVRQRAGLPPLIPSRRRSERGR